MMKITLREIARAVSGLPILKNAGFYFGLWGLVVTFAPRFGVVFTQAEIGQVTIFVGLLFGVTPPSVQYLQLKAYQARVKASKL